MKYVESPQQLLTKCNSYIDWESQCPYKNEFTFMLLILFADRDSLNVKSRFLAVFLFLSICPTFTCEGCVSEVFWGEGEEILFRAFAYKFANN